MDVLIPTILVGVLGLTFGFMLAWFAQKFAVPVNPLVQEVERILPGANCGACGFPGCSGLAEKIASGEAPVNACPVGGPGVWAELAKLLGQGSENWETKRVVLLCQGGKDVAQTVAEYAGISDCRAANILPGSFKGCRSGCLGLGNCVRVCPFDAIHVDGETGLPVVNWEKCTGCGKCVAECPRGILALVPKREQVCVACVSLDSAKDVRKVCTRGCIKCQVCIRNCPEGAITFENGRIAISREKCTLCGLCIEKCPTHCIIEIGKKEALLEVKG